MINRIVLFLIRRKLGIKKFQEFQFANQKTDAIYFFGHTGINKRWKGEEVPSNVSLKWILNDKCEIIKIKK